jgi:peptide/nickel transport system ATP-binding protein
MTTDCVLQLQDVTVEFGSGATAVRAVSQANLSLRRGEIFGIAGESGSGKSTLIYAIARTLAPAARVASGRVIYRPRDGAEIDFLQLRGDTLRVLRWASIAIVPQAAMNALNPVLTIETQLTDVLKAHGSGANKKARRERAAELVALVGISPDRLAAYPHQMSGGMRQRVMIAMALALDPDVLILDEPTTALDVVTQRQIIEEILSLRERLGLSIIFVTHDLSLLFELADRVAVMYAGNLVEMGAASVVRDAPLHPYSRALSASFPTLQRAPDDLARLPGSPPDLRAIPSGCAFHPRCAYAADACRSIVPVLERPAGLIGDEHAVSCHLHDPDIDMPRPADAPILSNEEVR